MKVTKENPFRPTTIVLETEREYFNLCRALDIASNYASSALRHPDSGEMRDFCRVLSSDLRQP